jgi:RNA polymerase sigma-70 factor (ECF subfamily)
METTRGLWRPELYRAYLRLLASSLLRTAGPARDKVDASDVAQEVLLQAHVALDQFRGTTEEEFTAWLRAILASKMADIARHFGRKKRDAALERRYLETLQASSVRLVKIIPSDRTSPTQHLARRDDALRLAEALSTLPDEQRQAIELHHVAGLSVAECAQSMGRSRASVAGLVRRGLKALREQLVEA